MLNGLPLLDGVLQLRRDEVERLRDDGVQHRVRSGDAEKLLPTARNSNLLPVKANGEVRLRSPASRGSFGSTLTPTSMNPPGSVFSGLPFSSWSMMSWSWSPRKIEMIAGGASFALQAVVVPGARHAHPEQFRVLRHRADDRHAEDEELRVVVRVVAGVEQVLAGVRRHTPVVVLARCR